MVDEYGQISGAVTIEDVLEQIVGEIEDEHDVDDDSFVKQLEANSFHVKANTTVEDFNDAGTTLVMKNSTPLAVWCCTNSGMYLSVVNPLFTPVWRSKYGCGFAPYSLTESRYWCPKWLMLTTEWRNGLLALLLGAVFPLGFAPLGWWPVSLLSAGLVFNPQFRAGRFAKLAWFFGLGKYLSGASGYVSINEYGNAPPLPVLVLLFVATLAVFMLPVGWSLRRLGLQHPG